MTAHAARRRWTAFGVLALAALGACSSPVAHKAPPGAGFDPGANFTPPPPSGFAMVQTPGEVASPPAVTATPRAGATLAVGSPAASPTPPTHAAGTSEAPLTANLDRTCVEPGQTQRLSLTTTPDYFVAFDTGYADGKEGRTYGGWATAKADGSGHYSNTWVVAANTPVGAAHVDLAISGHDAGGGNSTAFRQLPFTVAASC